MRGRRTRAESLAVYTRNVPPSSPDGLGPAYSRRLDRAIVLAALAHEGQRRKGTVVPYVTHPFNVSVILDRHGFAADVVVAGVLHDVIEDLDGADDATVARIRTIFPSAPESAQALGPEEYARAFGAFVARAFGQPVLDLVLAVTEQKTRDGVPVPWRARKEERLAAMRTASENALGLKGADLLHNMRSILNDASEIGPAVFARFKASPAETAWFYSEATALVLGRLGPHTLAAELEAVAREFTAMMERLGDPEKADAAGSAAGRRDEERET